MRLRKRLVEDEKVRKITKKNFSPTGYKLDFEFTIFFIDGNPVLGLGYDGGSTVTPSSTRVPPGGYSKGLW